MASIQDAYEALDRKEQQIKAIKKRERSMTDKVVGGIAGIVGGGSAGYVDGKWPDKNVFGQKIPLIGGAVLAMVDLAGWAGRGATSEMIGRFGFGMLDGEAYAFGYKKGSQPKQGSAGEIGYSAPNQLGGPAPSLQDLQQQFAAAAAAARR